MGAVAGAGPSQVGTSRTDFGRVEGVGSDFCTEGRATIVVFLLTIAGLLRLVGTAGGLYAYALEATLTGLGKRASIWVVVTNL